DGNGLEAGFALFDDLTYAGDSAARADAGDQNINLAVGVVPDLFGSGLAVDLGVGRVVELLGHEGIGIFFEDFFGLGDGAAHAFLSRGQQHRRSKRFEQPAAFETHAFRHGGDELVAAGRTGEGQGDAGVAAGRLDDDGVLIDFAVTFGGIDHR